MMSHQLVLDIPDDIYQPLVHQAEQAGKKPEELITAWLARAVSLGQDRLRRWAGAFDSRVPDVALRPDEYLGEGLHRDLPGKQDG